MTFKLEVNDKSCSGCGNCVIVCPINAFRAVEVAGGKGGGVELKVEGGISCVTYDTCNGCGVCVAACPQTAILLNTKEPSQFSKEVAVSGAEKDETEASAEKAVEGTGVLYAIDQKRKALLESMINSMKNIKVRYLIEAGNSNDAREGVLKKSK